MLKSWKSLVMIGVLLLNLPLLAWAGPAGRGPTGGGDGPDGSRLLQRMTRDLDLTTDQQQKIREIFDSERQQLTAEVDKLESQREEMRALEQERPLPVEKLRAVAREHAETRVDLAVAKAQTRDRIDAVLTPEQREKAKRLMAQRQERREERREWREDRRESRRCDGPQPCGPDCSGPARLGR